MRNILLPFCIILLILAGCSRKVAYQATGLITKPDYGMCPCCGGNFIEINGNRYRIRQLPPNSGIDLTKDSFVQVELNYTGPDGCDYINVQSIRRVK